MSWSFNPFTGNLDLSTSPGGSTTQIQFNDGGAFGGVSGLIWDKTTSTLTISGAPLALSGNISAASWGLNGLKIKGGGSTLTDTSTAGTVATGATNVFGGNTIAATNARTITDYYSAYINDPVAGTNVTLTNKWSLGLSGGIQVGGGNASFTGEATNVALIKAGNASVRANTSGALWLEVAGQTAGNARGAGAFDWQAERTVATQVASGTRAIALGARNISTATLSVAIGYSNSATATQAFAAGTGCTASATQAVAIGNLNSATAVYSVALGSYALANNKSLFALGNGLALGQSQGCMQVFYTETADATLTPLSTTGTATDRMVIPVTRSVAFIGIVQAMCNVSSSSNFIKAWKIEGVITRDGSNTTRLVGTPTITEIAKDSDGTPTPSTWAIASITADDTNEALAINVTGQAATTIRWQATLMYSQIGF